MDRRLGFGLIFLFAFFYSLSASAAVTLYVSGTDSTCGGNAPCFTTIQDAIDAARPQNIIRIQPGTYRESLSIKDKNSFSGAVELDRIVIEADPLALPGTVILTNKAICDNDADGDQEGDGDADESSSIIKIVHSQFITIRGLTLTGAGSSAIRLSGSRNQGIHIERNRIFRNGTESCGDAIRVLTGNPDTVIVNNLIYGNRRNAIAFRATNGGPHYV